MKFTLTGPIATILAALIAVIGIVIGAFLNPLANKIINRSTPTPSSESLKIEQIPQQIFSYSETGPEGWDVFWLIREDQGRTIYKFEYNLPSGESGFAGLAFNFTSGIDLSAYDAIELVIMFDQSLEEVDFYFKDIAKDLNTIRIANKGSNEMALHYKFVDFPNINFHAIQEIGVIVNADFMTGEHRVYLKDITFVK